MAEVLAGSNAPSRTEHVWPYREGRERRRNESEDVEFGRFHGALEAWKMSGFNE